MKTIYLGRDRKTEVKIMNEKEVLKFLENKTVYHWVVSWIEKWKPFNIKPEDINKDVLTYFPSSGFTLPKRITLAPRGHGYSENTLSGWTIKGKHISNYDRYKITIRKTKNKTLYYVTKI